MKQPQEVASLSAASNLRQKIYEQRKEKASLVVESSAGHSTAAAPELDPVRESSPLVEAESGPLVESPRDGEERSTPFPPSSKLDDSETVSEVEEEGGGGGEEDEEEEEDPISKIEREFWQRKSQMDLQLERRLSQLSLERQEGAEGGVTEGEAYAHTGGRRASTYEDMMSKMPHEDSEEEEEEEEEEETKEAWPVGMSPGVTDASLDRILEEELAPSSSSSDENVESDGESSSSEGDDEALLERIQQRILLSRARSMGSLPSRPSVLPTGVFNRSSSLGPRTLHSDGVPVTTPDRLPQLDNQSVSNHVHGTHRPQVSSNDPPPGSPTSVSALVRA